MTQFDLPLETLRTYSAKDTSPPDFDEFWASTLHESRQYDLDVVAEPVDNRLTLVKSKDVTFSGFGGHRIRAWLHTPAGAEAPLPTVVRYHGYSGGRGLAHQEQLYALAGYAHLVMDIRGQGWSMEGATPDPDVHAGSSTIPGFVTRGIQSPQNYYYRRLYTDAVRMVEAAAALPEVDESRIVVTGGSQGGALTMAAAAFSHVAGAMIDVPFMSDFARALQVTDADPYNELVRYLARYSGQDESAFRTISYFDTVNLARRAMAPALFSVGLQDTVAPPSTVFAAYNAYAGRSRSIEVYPHNGHEGGGVFHDGVKLDWLRELFGLPGSQ